MIVIKKPLIKGKTVEPNKKGITVYGFLVDLNANKIQIKKEIEAIYSVKVQDVNTLVYPRKKAVTRTRKFFKLGEHSMYKKAYIKLFVNFPNTY